MNGLVKYSLRLGLAAVALVTACSGRNEGNQVQTEGQPCAGGSMVPDSLGRIPIDGQAIDGKQLFLYEVGYSFIGMPDYLELGEVGKKNPWGAGRVALQGGKDYFNYDDGEAGAMAGTWKQGFDGNWRQVYVNIVVGGYGREMTVIHVNRSDQDDQSNNEYCSDGNGNFFTRSIESQ